MFWTIKNLNFINSSITPFFSIHHFCLTQRDTKKWNDKQANTKLDLFLVSFTHQQYPRLFFFPLLIWKLNTFNGQKLFYLECLTSTNLQTSKTSTKQNRMATISFLPRPTSSAGSKRCFLISLSNWKSRTSEMEFCIAGSLTTIIPTLSLLLKCLWAQKTSTNMQTI